MSVIVTRNYKKGPKNVYWGGMYAYQANPKKMIEGIYTKEQTGFKKVWPLINVKQVITTTNIGDWNMFGGMCKWIADFSKYVLLKGIPYNDCIEWKKGEISCLYTSPNGEDWTPIDTWVVDTSMAAGGFYPTMSGGGAMEYDSRTNSIYWLDTAGVSFIRETGEMDIGALYGLCIYNLQTNVFTYKPWESVTLEDYPGSMRKFLGSYSKDAKGNIVQPKPILNDVYPYMTEESLVKKLYMKSIKKYAAFNWEEQVAGQKQGIVEIYNSRDDTAPIAKIGTNYIYDYSEKSYNAYGGDLGYQWRGMIFDGPANSGEMLVCIYIPHEICSWGSGDRFWYITNWCKLKFNTKPFGNINVPELINLGISV